MATVVPAEGIILERVRQAIPLISFEGLSRQAYAKCDTVQMKTAWGRRHQRRFALIDGSDVLAGATRYDISAVLDQRPVRVGGIGEIFTHPAHGATGPARELVDQLLDEGARDGAAAYVLVSIVGDTWTIEECGDRDPSGAAPSIDPIMRVPVTRPDFADWGEGMWRRV